MTGPRALSPFDIAVAATLVALAVLYYRGAATAPRREAAAFWIGWVVLLLSALPPIDRLAVVLFSVHMAQHELMVLVGVPLVIAGRPLPAVLTGLPAAWRSRAIRFLQRPATATAWRWAIEPAVAWTVHGTVMWVGHLPALYDAAVANEAIHVVQHAVFAGSAALFWTGMLQGRYGRAGYGAAVLYVFTTAVHTSALGAVLTFAPAALYDSYPSRADQQVAGLIMWVPAGLVLTMFGIGLFAAWLGDAGRRRTTRSRPARTAGASGRSDAGTADRSSSCSDSPLAAKPPRSPSLP